VRFMQIKLGVGSSLGRRPLRQVQNLGMMWDLFVLKGHLYEQQCPQGNGGMCVTIDVCCVKKFRYLDVGFASIERTFIS